MHFALSYFLAAGAGLLIAHMISRAPELRSMRLSQLILIPAGLVLCVSLPGDIPGLVAFVAILGFLILLTTPNIAYYCGVGLSNFLVPQDWTSADEEIALRPIRRLIDKDQNIQAFDELEELLGRYKPTYEARLLQAKLLYHFGRVNETVAALLSLIELSQSTAQQLTVMELLASLENQHRPSPKPSLPGVRRIQTRHELVLFQTDGGASPLHKAIPPGSYLVEEISRGNRRWLNLAGEDWGNAEMCWEAVRSTERPVGARPGKSLLRRIARMHQAIGAAFKRKPRLHLQAEAQKLLQEASQLIRCNDWPGALPLLQKASALDPDRYEIAYRWVQAVRQTANEGAAAQAVRKVLKQSQWTDSEKAMLRQLTNRA
jgi:tetratricopeptide (TPR) repeat protein